MSYRSLFRRTLSGGECKLSENTISLFGVDVPQVRGTGSDVCTRISSAMQDANGFIMESFVNQGLESIVFDMKNGKHARILKLSYVGYPPFTANMQRVQGRAARETEHIQSTTDSTLSVGGDGLASEAKNMLFVLNLEDYNRLEVNDTLTINISTTYGFVNYKFIITCKLGNQYILVSDALNDFYIPYDRVHEFTVHQEISNKYDFDRIKAIYGSIAISEHHAVIAASKQVIARNAVRAFDAQFGEMNRSAVEGVEEKGAEEKGAEDNGAEEKWAEENAIPVNIPETYSINTHPHRMQGRSMIDLEVIMSRAPGITFKDMYKRMTASTPSEENHDYFMRVMHKLGYTLGTFLFKLHTMGITHGDFHGDNIMVDNFLTDDNLVVSVIDWTRLSLDMHNTQPFDMDQDWYKARMYDFYMAAYTFRSCSTVLDAYQQEFLQSLIRQYIVLENRYVGTKMLFTSFIVPVHRRRIDFKSVITNGSKLRLLHEDQILTVTSVASDGTLATNPPLAFTPKITRLHVDTKCMDNEYLINGIMMQCLFYTKAERLKPLLRDYLVICNATNDFLSQTTLSDNYFLEQLAARMQVSVAQRKSVGDIFLGTRS